MNLFFSSVKISESLGNFIVLAWNTTLGWKIISSHKHKIDAEKVQKLLLLKKTKQDIKNEVEKMDNRCNTFVLDCYKEEEVSTNENSPKKVRKFSYC